MQKRAAKVGFDWAAADGAADKIAEELAEVREVAHQAAQDEDRDRRLEEEVGDLLFSVVNYARKLEVEPELALDRACEKFILRFTDMEAAIRAEGGELESMSLEEMDIWWERVKSARSPGGIQ